MLEGIIALAAGAAIGAVLCAAMYERELRRMARLLSARDETSNARMTVAIPGGGARALARSVNRQLDRVQDERVAAQRRQMEFQRGLSALSHDVRTPLTGAKGHVQLAQDALAAPDAASASAHLQSAEARIDDTRALLDQLFVYARAEDADSHVKIEDVAVFPLMVSVLAGHMPDFERLGWEPDVAFFDEGLRASADAEALTRIFDNLVENALRHGSAAPRIVQSGMDITFSNKVADPQRIDTSRLFERFYQADASRGGKGAGLGLAVVSRLAEAMGMRASAALEGDVLSITVHLA